MAPLVDQGTDCEDELLTPACPPAVVDQQIDRELQKVFVVSLPTMVTPVCDMDGTLRYGRIPQAECPVVAPPAVPAFVNWPSQFIGGAETCVADSIFSTAGVGGCFAGSQIASVGNCT